MTEPIGVIGLGVMGSAMAGNLISAGHEVLGFDIDPTRVSTFVDLGGEPATSADEIAALSDLVIFSLPTTAALASVAAEIAEQDRPGLVCLEMGTFPLQDKIAARDCPLRRRSRSPRHPTFGHRSPSRRRHAGRVRLGQPRGFREGPAGL